MNIPDNLPPPSVKATPIPNTGTNPIAKTESQSLKKKRILMVDDEPMILNMFIRILEFKRPGEFEVITANNLSSAQSILKTDTNFDLIISDKDMPKIDDGLVLAKERPQNIPFILISGRIADVKDPASYNINITLAKPVKVEDFLKSIDTLLYTIIGETPASIGARAKVEVKDKTTPL